MGEAAPRDGEDGDGEDGDGEDGGRWTVDGARDVLLPLRVWSLGGNVAFAVAEELERRGEEVGLLTLAVLWAGRDCWTTGRTSGVLDLLRVIRNNVAVARSHRSGRVRGPMLFAAATANPPSTAEKLASWKSLVDDHIDVVEVDCRHQHMLLPAPIARIGAALTQRPAAGTAG